MTGHPQRSISQKELNRHSRLLTRARAAMRSRRNAVAWLAVHAIALSLALVGLSATAQAQTKCRDTPEGRVCTHQQRIVGAAQVVSQQTQQDLGLIALPGCSGTLVNRFWVL